MTGEWLAGQKRGEISHGQGTFVNRAPSCHSHFVLLFPVARKPMCTCTGPRSKRINLQFAARGGGEGALSQAASRAASAMLRMLQQHKTQLPGKAFALHSAGGMPLPAAPGPPLPAPGPMAAAALLGVLKGEVHCNTVHSTLQKAVCRC